MHHDSSVVPSSGEKAKPEIIAFYNATKSAVDTVDQMCNSYSVSRITSSWPMVVFFSMLNVAAVNAQIIFLSNNVTDRLTRCGFLKNLARSLADDYLRVRSQCTSLPGSLKRSLQDLFPEKEESIGQGKVHCAKKKLVIKRQRCYVCRGSRSRLTRYRCRNCEKYLCLQHAEIICSDC
ncbi:hypothetical protein X975_16753, partial [Stegodyphus mimosarum]